MERHSDFGRAKDLMRDIAGGARAAFMADIRTGLRTLTFAAASLCICGASAQQQDSPLKSAAKILGFATDVEPPADFVLQSRPKGDLDYIPVFRRPPEPAKKPLDAKQLSAVKGDLDSVEKRDDAIRRGFPPSARAMAEEEAARKAKQRAKAAAQAK